MKPNYSRVLFIICILVIIVSKHQSVKAQDIITNDGNYHSVYVMSNTADLPDQKHLLAQLENEFSSHEEPFTLLMGGDAFDLSKSLKEQFHQLDNLYDIIRLVSKYNNGRIIMITGDRDWSGRTKRGGLALLELEERVLDFVSLNNINNFEWLINHGCPGPFKISIDDHIKVLALNSQWWNEESNKPQAADGVCKNIQLAEIKEELEDEIEENLEKNIIIFAHHPVISVGRYGGRFSFMDYQKPFPVAGLFRTAYSISIGRSNDLSNKNFKEYQEMLEDVIFKQDNVIYISGHEHNHQILKEDNNYLINSGLVNGKGFSPKGRTSLLNNGDSGLMRVTYYSSGRVDAKLLRFETKPSVEDEVQLFSSFCYIAKDFPKNFTYVPCKETLPFFNDYLEHNDSELISAGRHYKKGAFGKIWFGKHYRKEWNEVIYVQKLNLDTMYGGLTVLKKGGGRQTLSLKFNSANGTRYTFRSVDKDPSRSLNHTLDHSIIGKVFRDQTSAQYPFGAIIVSSLLDHLDILHVKPQMYLMPSSDALHVFNEQYGGLLGMLEELPGKKNKEGKRFADADDIFKSYELFKKMYNDHSYQVKDREFLRARLFDILIGDWSRHEDNWKWAMYDEGDVKICRPIPRDRDWAFSKWDGILPSIADMPFALKITESFDHKIKGFQSAVYQARYLDRFLLTEMTLEDFIAEAEYIQQHITEEKIKYAVNLVPPEAYPHSGDVIVSKLKQRKKDLVKYARKYFKWLNKEVDVVATNQNDIITVEKTEEHHIKITLADSLKNIYFEREFDDRQTKLIKIYGLNGDDIFYYKNLEPGDLKVLFFGGKGLDEYTGEEVTAKIKAYDRENLKAENTAGFVFKKPWNDKLFDYNREGRKFNSWFPIVSLGYSEYTGFTIAGGNNWKLQKWNKEKYASEHRLRASLSSLGDYGLEYSGNWRHVLKKWDLIMDLSIANPEFYNSFYGLGNQTKIDEDLEEQDYYVTKYGQFIYHLGVNRTFWRKSKFNVKFGVSAFRSSLLDNTIIEDQADDLIGVDETLFALPIHLGLKLDFLDHSNFPYRGVRFKFGVDNYFQLTDSNKDYGRINSSFEYYTSNHTDKKLTLGIKLFGSRAYGQIPYYLLSSIGGNHGLRGYSSFRFVGDKSVYINTDLRWRLVESLESVIPYEFGILGFYDMGRVFNDGEDIGISKMNTGYGGGVYLVPLSRTFAFSVSLAWSKEESFYPVISFGSFFN